MKIINGLLYTKVLNLIYKIRKYYDAGKMKHVGDICVGDYVIYDLGQILTKYNVMGLTQIPDIDLENSLITKNSKILNLMMGDLINLEKYGVNN